MIFVCGVIAFVPVFNSVFSAFNDSYYARWFYMPILIMAAMTAGVIQTGRKAELVSAAKVTFLITLCIMLSAFVPTLSKGRLKWMSICDNMDLLIIEIAATAVQLLILLFLIMALPGITPLRRFKKPVFLAATILCCFVTNVAVLYNGNSLIARTGGVKWRKQMLETRPELRDTSTFFRVETDGTSTNYEMVWGYPTIHCFESTVNPSIFTFYRKIGMIRSVESTLPVDRVGARSLLSTRYYIENSLVKPAETIEDKGGLVGYEQVDANNGYRIFENNNYIPMGFTFDSYIRDDDYSAMKKGEMTDRLLVKDIILTEEQCAKYGKYMQEDDHAGEEVMSEEDFARHCRNRAACACSEFEFTTSGFRAVSDIEKENLVFFSVPYDPGFTARVDGEEVVIEKVDGGLMAIPVPAGEHNIEFTYFPAGLKVCSIISMLTAAVIIVGVIWENVRSGKTNVLAIKNKA